MGPIAVVAALAALAPLTALAADPPVPSLVWGACPAGQPGADRFDCATAGVPMDYADPAGPTFSLALIKAPARDAANRIGTLFWNPGGPSDAGTAYLPAAIGGFPAQVRDRFDIVSWDPRGMGGRTTPVVQCFDSAEDEAAFLERARARQPAGDAGGARRRRRRAGPRSTPPASPANGDLLAHVSTADNARDLDLLRQAVGEERLSYYGTSYGTFLGATYVNMFPDRVRAAVLDGAVAPSAWAGGPGEDLSLSTFIRLGSDFGSRRPSAPSWTSAARSTPTACAFSAGSPEATRTKWSRPARARRRPA